MSDTLPSPVNPQRSWTDRLAVRSEAIDLAVGIGLVVLAAAFWLGAASFDETDTTGIGAATFPRGIAVLLGVAAAMLVARAFMALSGRVPTGITVTQRPGHVVAGMGLVILFPVLMTNLGILPRLCALDARAVRRRRIPQADRHRLAHRGISRLREGRLRDDARTCASHEGVK